jgi:oligopeptide/dipeptide ABC transporter ATP-binding protein
VLRNLRTNFYTYAGVVKALDGVDLEVRKGETLGLVGETGCGKSVTARSIMRLVPEPGRIDDGTVVLHGVNLLGLSEDGMRKVRGNTITMVFQDPTTFLNPVMTIGDQIAETFLIHHDARANMLTQQIERRSEDAGQGQSTGSAVEIERSNKARVMDFVSYKRELRQAAAERSKELLRIVRMPDPENVLRQYPHQLSGGMKQRVMIAMAIACNPELLIADEPTTALDVTIQAQILDLLTDIKKEVGLSILLITHDLGVVAETCDRVAIMYAGNIVEVCSTMRLFENPLHPYTQALLQAIPKLDERRDMLETIRGSVPNLINPPSGCRYNPRCPFAMAECSAKKPLLEEVEPEHFVACFLRTAKEAN